MSWSISPSRRFLSFHTFLPTPIRPSLSTLNLDNNSQHGGSRKSIGPFDPRVGCGETGDSAFSSVAFCRSDLPTGRLLKVKSVIREVILLSWYSGQSWHVRCSFGTVSLPSEWRSISCGNQRGVSWSVCTSFNGTCPLLISYCFLSLVSPMCFLSSYSHYFL